MKGSIGRRGGNPRLERLPWVGELDNAFGAPWKVKREYGSDDSLVSITIRNCYDDEIAKPYQHDLPARGLKKRLALEVYRFTTNVVNACFEVRGRGARSGQTKLSWDSACVPHILPVFEAAHTLASVISETKKSDATRDDLKTWWRELSDPSWLTELERRIKDPIIKSAWGTLLTSVPIFARDHYLRYQIRDSFNAFLTTASYHQPLLSFVDMITPGVVDQMDANPALKEARATIADLEPKLRNDPKNETMLKEYRAAKKARGALTIARREMSERAEERKTYRYAAWNGVLTETINAFYIALEKGWGLPDCFPGVVDALRRGTPDIERLAVLLREGAPEQSEKLREALGRIHDAFLSFDSDRDGNDKLLHATTEARLAKRDEVREAVSSFGAAADEAGKEKPVPKNRPAKKRGKEEQLDLLAFERK